MPQMAPTWWSLLFITFLLTFIVFITNLYFLSSSKTTLKKELKKTPNINWKW